MPRYNPPTKVVRIDIPFLSIVTQADPEWGYRKHRELEYQMANGRPFYADPYVRGAYNTPKKSTTVNYAGPVTLNAGDITGVGGDFVTLISTNLLPGTLTTRTAVQMFTDIAGAAPNLGYALRVVNNANGADLILSPGVGVALRDMSNRPTTQFVIGSNDYWDFTVQFPDSATATISVSSQNNPYSAIIG